MNQNPKEKAIQLVKDFSPLVYPYRGSSMLTNDTYEDVILGHAKECALKVVSQVYEEFTTSLPNDLFVIRVGYWNQVEQAIKEMEELPK